MRTLTTLEPIAPFKQEEVNASPRNTLYSAREPIEANTVISVDLIPVQRVLTLWLQNENATERIFVSFVNENETTDDTIVEVFPSRTIVVPLPKGTARLDILNQSNTNTSLLVVIF